MAGHVQAAQHRSCERLTSIATLHQFGSDKVLEQKITVQCGLDGLRANTEIASIHTNLSPRRGLLRI